MFKLMDWIFDSEYGGLVIAGGAVAFVAAICAALFYGMARERQAFMSACTTDLKEYECIAMWRAGRGSLTPVFIPKP